MKTNHYDPAYPCDKYLNVAMQGLTKREYFAALAMQGIITGESVIKPLSTAQAAVNCADALIDELNKSDESKG